MTQILQEELRLEKYLSGGRKASAPNAPSKWSERAVTPDANRTIKKSPSSEPFPKVTPTARDQVRAAYQSTPNGGGGGLVSRMIKFEEERLSKMNQPVASKSAISPKKQSQSLSSATSPSVTQAPPSPKRSPLPPLQQAPASETPSNSGMADVPSPRSVKSHVSSPSLVSRTSYFSQITPSSRTRSPIPKMESLSSIRKESTPTQSEGASSPLQPAKSEDSPLVSGKSEDVSTDSSNSYERASSNKIDSSSSYEASLPSSLIPDPIVSALIEPPMTPPMSPIVPLGPTPPTIRRDQTDGIDRIPSASSFDPDPSIFGELDDILKSINELAPSSESKPKPSASVISPPHRRIPKLLRHASSNLDEITNLIQHFGNVAKSASGEKETEVRSRMDNIGAISITRSPSEIGSECDIVKKSIKDYLTTFQDELTRVYKREIHVTLDWKSLEISEKIPMKLGLEYLWIDILPKLLKQLVQVEFQDFILRNLDSILIRRIPVETKIEISGKNLEIFLEIYGSVKDASGTLKTIRNFLALSSIPPPLPQKESPPKIEKSSSNSSLSSNLSFNLNSSREMDEVEEENFVKKSEQEIPTPKSLRNFIDLIIEHIRPLIAQLRLEDPTLFKKEDFAIDINMLVRIVNSGTYLLTSDTSSKVREMSKTFIKESTKFLRNLTSMLSEKDRKISVEEFDEISEKLRSGFHEILLVLKNAESHAKTVALNPARVTLQRKSRFIQQIVKNSEPDFEAFNSATADLVKWVRKDMPAVTTDSDEEQDIGNQVKEMLMRGISWRDEETQTSKQELIEALVQLETPSPRPVRHRHAQ
eukprot:TRINITY_DN4376_c0_g1_i5.p1 TRINITY_DN4376_c0_g1~~TRINITY_DN4376_c0_g1_i5.p1  ORF type:complete len:817 (+),score=271.25 TRINITY_DN4376_c0_g1_i5:13-2463(+)